ncbi:Multidrug resistance protein abc superfamily, partial [Globisporangium splendens]
MRRVQRCSLYALVVVGAAVFSASLTPILGVDALSFATEPRISTGSVVLSSPLKQNEQQQSFYNCTPSTPPPAAAATTLHPDNAMTAKTYPGEHYTVVETPQQNRLEVDFAHIDQPVGESASKQDTTIDGKLMSLTELFAYADKTDKWLVVFGSFGGLVAGMAEPLQIVLFGDVLNSFNPTKTLDPAVMRKDINSVALNFVLAGIVVFVASFVQVACWSISASRQVNRIRGDYVSAIITKEIGWFDVNEPMQLSTRIADVTVTIQEGMGSKVGDGLRFFSMGVCGIVIGFVKGWELTLVLIALTPFIAFTAYLSTKVLSSATHSGIESYGKAGAIAQESLSNIRTVHMFNSIRHFIHKYDEALGLSTKAGIKKGFAVGWGTGLLYFTMFCAYAIGMYFGAWKIASDQLEGNRCAGSGCYDGGKVLVVFFLVVKAAMGMGQAGPCIQAIFSARAAAYDVFEVIKRKSLIDPLSDDGKKLTNVAGEIEIDSVSFAYPSRPEVKVCNNYSLKIKAGETVALVGPSGSGKSTIVSLLERFYDPLSGSVRLDGVDVRELNVKWLREQVGLVGQEPSLFATSIMENIRYGAPSATNDQVIEAAEMANAHNFIKEFPQGFATEVGERGTQLSGGQKQRIAIARAIIRNPPILLLDEATSALDTESERIVQESLDSLLATTKRTTIIVAHRLSTIRNADRIAVHSGGSIVEIGSHDELMDLPNGHYRMLVEAQNRSQTEGKKHAVEDMKQANFQSVALDIEQRRSMSLSTRSLSKLSLHDNAKPLEDDDASDGGADALAPNVSMTRLWKLSLPEWRFLLAGSFGAVVNASIYPVWGVLLSKMIVLFFQYQKTKHEMLKDAAYWSIGFLGLGTTFGLSIIIQNVGFAVASQKLVSRVRLATFSAMLRQEVGWFDLDENSSGALVSRLAADSAILQAATSDKLNQGLVNATTMGIALGISLIYSWQMTLAMLATSPILIFRSCMEAKQMSGAISKKKNNTADAAAGSLVAEAIGSIRTVASFSMEKAVNKAYVAFIGESKSTDISTGIIAGVSFAISQGTLFLTLAYLFWIGGLWVSKDIITFEDMFTVIAVIMMSTLAVGMAAQNTTANAKAKLAAKRVFKIIDRVPEIDSTSPTGIVLPHVNGDIEFKILTFTYPSRPDAQIYKNYSLKIARGQTVALVGASGSGKSTAISLLERFYDPTSGIVTLDGTDLRDLSLPWLRERISLVSQEPVLFAGTIAENIAMGKPGATREEVVEAAKKANAFDFINNFPDGFDTDAGDRGAQISGGQKQRIAIARAILRDPEVLLLDEATSALDSESERVVQESLDRLLASKQRTTIIVAHRLSTIRNADVIAVTQDGAIVEQGTHDELMCMSNGIYKLLASRQMSGQSGCRERKGNSI